MSILIFILAAFSYAISIFIDVSVYHLKYYIQDSKNVRFLLSLINIFQYSARAFILIFIPIMAFITESLKDKELVWNITILSHVLVIIFLLPLFLNKFVSYFSYKVIKILNYIFGNSKKINLNIIQVNSFQIKNLYAFNSKFFLFFIVAYFSGFLFSISITFLYYLSFSFPQKALTLSSFTQIINMFGSLILILFIDPKIMSSIDNEEGHQEIILLTLSRVLVHITLIVILFVIK
jgi:hypothetical protein